MSTSRQPRRARTATPPRRRRSPASAIKDRLNIRMHGTVRAMAEECMRQLGFSSVSGFLEQCVRHEYFLLTKHALERAERG